MQDCSNSSVLVTELLQSCTEPSACITTFIIIFIIIIIIIIIIVVFIFPGAYVYLWDSRTRKNLAKLDMMNALAIDSFLMCANSLSGK